MIFYDILMISDSGSTQFLYRFSVQRIPKEHGFHMIPWGASSCWNTHHLRFQAVLQLPIAQLADFQLYVHFQYVKACPSSSIGEISMEKALETILPQMAS